MILGIVYFAVFALIAWSVIYMCIKVVGMARGTRSCSCGKGSSCSACTGKSCGGCAHSAKCGGDCPK